LKSYHGPTRQEIGNQKWYLEGKSCGTVVSNTSAIVENSEMEIINISQEKALFQMHFEWKACMSHILQQVCKILFTQKQFFIF